MSPNHIYKELNMIKESNRFETFNKNWIFSDDKNCNAAKLAQAGFYYTGTQEAPDSVTCFLCDKSLEGWEEDDDPWEEHRGHHNNCGFVRLNKNEDDLTLQEYLDISDMHVHDVVRKEEKRLELKRAAFIAVMTAYKKCVKKQYR